MANIKSVGPDAPVEVDPETGAKQSATEFRCDLLPPLATLRVAQILCQGAIKYEEWNWIPIPYDEHLNHALVHIFAHLAGDDSDDHIGHAACRMMMCLERTLLNREVSALDQLDR